MKRILLLICLLGANVIACAQNAQSMTPDEAFREIGKVLDRELENHKAALGNQFEAARVDFREEVNEDLHQINDKATMIRMWFWILSGLTVIGWIASWWGMINYASGRLRKIVTDEIEEKYPNMVEKVIHGIIDRDSDSFKRLVREQSFEAEVKRRMPLTVVCSNNHEKQKAEVLVKQILEFERAEFRLMDDFKDDTDANLIVYYDLEGDLTDNYEPKIIKQLSDAKRSSDGNIYIVCTRKHWQPLNSYRIVANAANSPYTLYSRIMESLTYLYLKKLKAGGYNNPFLEDKQ